MTEQTMPLTYSFETSGNDEEVRIIDVAVQLLGPVYPDVRARIVRYLSRRYLGEDAEAAS